MAPWIDRGGAWACLRRSTSDAPCSSEDSRRKAYAANSMRSRSGPSDFIPARLPEREVVRKRRGAVRLRRSRLLRQTLNVEEVLQRLGQPTMKFLDRERAGHAGDFGEGAPL